MELWFRPVTSLDGHTRPSSITTIYIATPERDIMKKPETTWTASQLSGSLRGIDVALPSLAPAATLPTLPASTTKPNLAFSPPISTAAYEKKALPPVPLTRHSAASDFSTEVDHAFKTPPPKASPDLSGHPDRMHYGDDPGNEKNWPLKEEPEFAVILDRSTARPLQAPGRVARTMPAKPRIDIAIHPPEAFPNTPPDEVLSPQPRKSVQKILRLTSSSQPVVTSPSVSSPSGHKPGHKIRQLMGVDVDVNPVAARGGSSMSPLTLVNSTFSKNWFEPAVAEPDVGMHTSYYDDEDEHDTNNKRIVSGGRSSPGRLESLRNSPSHRGISWASQPAFLPASLRIRKARKQSVSSSNRHSDPVARPPESHAPLPAATEESPKTRRSVRFQDARTALDRSSSHYSQGDSSSSDGRNSNSSGDLSYAYHAAAEEIAFYTSTGLAPRRHSLQPGIDEAPADRPRASYSLFPSTTASPNQNRLQEHGLLTRNESHSGQDHRPGTRHGAPASVRTGVAASLTEPSKTSFGTGAHPLKTPYPPQSVFDLDDDDVDDQGKEGGRLGYRRSVVAKMFGRHGHKHRSGESSGTTGTGSSRPESADSFATAPEHRDFYHHHHHQRSGVARARSDRQGEQVLLTNRSRHVGGPDTPHPSASGGSMGALLDQVKGAVGIKSTVERRRENLKNKIRVVAEDVPAGQEPISAGASSQPPERPAWLLTSRYGEKFDSWL